jgi:hypothetical protein
MNKKLLQSERYWRTSSARLTEDQWLAKIELIPCRIVRIQVACIVWWDYVKETGWPKFKKYLTERKLSQRADKEATRQALIGLGYPERIATEHVRVMR